MRMHEGPGGRPAAMFKSMPGLSRVLWALLASLASAVVARHQGPADVPVLPHHGPSSNAWQQENGPELNFTTGVRRQLIVGGRKPLDNEFPYFVSFVRDQRALMGGGALIAPDLVLTADHVAYVGDEVIWGGEVQELRGRRSERRRIVEVIRHPKADPETLEWDVAVARLNRPIRRAAVVSLPDRPWGHNAFLEKPLSVLGRGSQQLDDSASDGTDYSLREAQLFQVPIERCRMIYGSRSHKGLKLLVTDSMMCAWGTGMDACVGDSGGPLVLKGGAEGDLQVGVVSWGAQCGHRYHPGVYHRLDASAEWVRSVMRRFRRGGESSSSSSSRRCDSSDCKRRRRMLSSSG